MAIATIDGHSRTGGFPAAADESRRGNDGSTLVYHIESQLRTVAPAAMGHTGALVFVETDARVMAGPFAGGRLRGLERVTLRGEGPAVMEGCQGIDVGDAHVAVDFRASVHPANRSRLPSPGVFAAPGYDFPDEDLRITGSALIRTASPRYSHLDGTVARIEGWVNFASGELEMEARSAQPTRA